MATDVKATRPLTATGAFLDQNGQPVQRTRIKAFYAECGANGGSVVITNGNGGETLMNIAVPNVAVTGYVHFELPGEGILAQDSLYGTVVNVASTVIFYG